MDFNDYIPAEVVVIGRAQNVMCGCSKGILIDDSPVQAWRTIIVDDID